MRRSRNFAFRVVLLLFASALQSCAGVGGIKQRLSPLDDAQEAIAQMKITPSKLRISGAVDRRSRTYGKGDEIRFEVEVNEPAYVAILEVRPDGKTTLLFPNKAHPKALFPANTRIAIPGPNDRYAILAGRAGNILIEFIASTSGRSWLFHRQPSGASDFADLGAVTHLLARDIAKAVQHGAAAAASHTVIHVKAG